jgi:LacI family transcriptional regulator
MRRAQAREVGFIFKNVSLARMTPFLNGANAVLNQAGSIMVLGLAENSAAALAHLRSFGQHRIDEVLLALSEDPDPEILNSINQMHLNAVFVNQVPPSAQRGILVDFHTSTIEALRCLIGFGHRRVALLASNNHSYIRKSVIDGYVEGHNGAGLPVDPDLIRTMGPRIETAATETSALLAKENPPTAFIVSSDAVLAGAARAVQSKGLSIGRDVSFITMGDSDLADLMTPAITAIRWDVHEMGRLAAMLLLDGREIAGPAPRPVLVPFEIVLRQSCQPVSHGKT